MRLSGGPAFIKYLLFVFNLVFVITGITILSIGAVIQGVYFHYHHFLDNKYLSAPALLIAVGAIVLIVSFLGCFGSIKENHCMILSFSILLMIVFIMELSGGIAGYVLKNEAAEVLKRKLSNTSMSYSTNPEITKMWDLLQRGLDCCGVNSSADWKLVFHNDSLPLSCCYMKDGIIENFTCSNLSSNIRNDSCVHALGDFVMKHAAVIGGSGIGIAFIQLLGVVLSCMLATSIRRNYENV